MTKKLVTAGWVLLALVLTASAQRLEVVRKILLPGAGGWTSASVDPRSGHVFLARESGVLSVDVEAGKVLSEFVSPSKIGAIAVVPSTDHVYLASSEDGSVPVFEIHRMNALGKVLTEGKPWEMAWEDATHRLFVTNHGSSDVTVVDGDDGEVEGRLTLEGQPRSVAAGAKGRVYITVEDKGEIVEVDAASMSVSKRWFLGACQSPSGISSDARNHRLFVSCGNRILAVTDVETGRVLSMASTGWGSGQTAYDPARMRVLSLASDGALTVAVEAAPGDFTTLASLETHAAAPVMAANFTRREVYVPSFDSDSGGSVMLVISY